MTFFGKCALCEKEAEGVRIIGNKNNKITLLSCKEHLDDSQDAELQVLYEKHKRQIKGHPLIRLKYFIGRNLHRFKLYRKYWNWKYGIK